MSYCNGCGGLVGRDCFNPQECEWITQQMNNDVATDHDALKARVCQLETWLTEYRDNLKKENVFHKNTAVIRSINELLNPTLSNTP